ncbi:hypothetical protein K8T06_12025 [bacterium]|nr:hypothetical protein [bacterium]
MKQKPVLFGTSGIRGIFSACHTAHPVHEFVRKNLVTSELAWLLGRAVAALHNESGNHFPVEIWRDVRDSGNVLVASLIRGLRFGNAKALYRGIAPTTVYTMRNDRWVIVVTASHNPLEFNGFKVFQKGRPLIREQEEKLETLLSQWADNMSQYTEPDDSVCLDPCDNTRLIQMKYFRENPVMQSLKKRDQSLLYDSYLPLDLAYGAAACPVDDSGRITQLSPQMAILLSFGFPIVGYGCTQDSQKTNFRIGAAYAYGETAEQPGYYELRAFASGESGYGDSADRIVFWPVIPDKKSDQKILEWINKPDLAGVYYSVENNFSEEKNCVLIVHIDDQSTPETLLSAINNEIDLRKPLPGFMVDCDADRILVTTPSLADTDIPYLTGDGMIRFFAETAPPETFVEVAFTVESGLALDVALDRLVLSHEKMGKQPFHIRKVTVGDRAIIDCFMDAGPGFRMGGEPSGHIIFCNTEQNTTVLTDDPFITYLKLLDSIMDRGVSLDNILEQLYDMVPEVFCARKPDAQGNNGLTSAEKSQLELWKEGEWGVLSQYATVFVPGYVSMYCKMIDNVFCLDSTPQIVFSSEWKKLQTNCLDLPEAGWNMPLAEILYKDNRTLVASLYLDPRKWAGPEIIRIVFHSQKAEGDNLFLIGEGVFRNSGTSPKNAGYHKLWPEDPWNGEIISNKLLRDNLRQLAVYRAEFTNKYISG